MKKQIAILLSAVMAANALAIPTSAGTISSTRSDKEIEKRIEEVGREYIDFYRNGYKELETEYDMAFAVDEESLAVEEAEFYVEEMAAPMPADGGSRQKSQSAQNMALAGTTETAFEEAADDGTLIGSLIPEEPFNTESYSPVEESGFVSPRTQPFSTFGADVDTASYSSLRRKLLEPYAYGGDPYFSGIDDSAIRVEEMMNYFHYHYAEPEDGEKFGVTTALNPCPWNPDTLLFKVGIKAEEYPKTSKGSNIVFLIDTSGSMFDFDKLDLVKTSLEFLIEKLDHDDVISIVTYAGSEEVVLEGAAGDERRKILSAVNKLEAWGSTWGEGGIEKAYEIAAKYFIEGGNNRVILCTDGDFNVGVSSEAGLKDLISKKRETGVFFSCLGFGSGNYNDTTMETLADNGNGNYFYIDCVREAERALSEEFFSTIYTVAKDTKFQVEFNPETVKGYRLIGYENRKMAAEDFADDTKDGGEVGAGQTVTVLYELVPSDSPYEIPEVSSRYGSKAAASDAAGAEAAAGFGDELLVVNIRYKEPDADTSVLREYPVSAGDLAEEMDEDTSWAAGVAQAGMLMRDSAYAGTSSFDDIYKRLMYDSEVMDNDFKAQFLFMLKAMKDYKGSGEE